MPKAARAQFKTPENYTFHERMLEREWNERQRQRTDRNRAEDYATEVYDWALTPDELYLAAAQAEDRHTAVEYVLDNWAHPGRQDRPPRRKRSA